jgi:DNA invertase Pin-like site-specific DNA recombinase
MKVGYVRVSASDPDASIQLDMLKQAGCKQIFIDKADVIQREHPGLETTFSYMQEGDTLVVWRLDRLARSLLNLVEIVNHLAEQGLEFQSLQESIDTTGSDGQLVFRTFAILGSFQRDLNRERTQAGLAAAKARGRKGGRPKGLSKKAQRKAILAEKLYLDGELTIREMCEELSISRGTLYNYLRYRGVKRDVPYRATGA